MKKISVIVPVYNTGKYIRKCIDSIVCQTYKEIEIIIVDDGSDKLTADICDELSEEDERIHIYHKENEGVSIARNYGMSMATGDYIGFVDSDDWIDSDMYMSLLVKIQETNADIVFCDARTIWDNGKMEEDTFKDIPSFLSDKTEVLPPGTLCQLAGSAWRGLYKSSTLAGVYFPNGLKFSEDRYFNLQAISKAKSIYYMKKAFYNRFMRIGSCVNSYHDNGMSIIKNSYQMIDTFVETTWGKYYLHPFYVQRAYSYIALLYGVFKSSKSILSKYREVKHIASDDDLLNLLGSLTLSDIRFRLISNKMYTILFLLLFTHYNYKKLKS